MTPWSDLSLLDTLCGLTNSCNRMAPIQSVRCHLSFRQLPLSDGAESGDDALELMVRYPAFEWWVMLVGQGGRKQRA